MEFWEVIQLVGPWGAWVPWIIKAYQKWCTLGRLDLYPDSKVEIGYSGLGLTVGLGGVFVARAQDHFINSAKIQIVRKKDNATHILDWQFFRESKGIIAIPDTPGAISQFQTNVELRLTQPFRVVVNQPQPQNILFIDQSFLQEEFNPLLNKVKHEYWMSFNDTVEGPNSRLKNDDFSQKFMNRSSGRQFETKIMELCYWRPGQYQLILEVDVVDKKLPESYQSSFELTENDCSGLRTNTYLIIKAACNFKVPQFFFAYTAHEDFKRIRHR